MKSINKIIPLFVSCLFLGFTACVEEAEYTPAETPMSAQVYFSSSLLSRVALSQDLNVTSYDVKLYRIDKTNALAVNLTAETESPDIFTIPATVNFDAGSDVATITITYDPSKLDYGVYKSIRIAVSDAAQTSPYGTSIYAFTAGIPEPWESLGIATFSDFYIFGNAYDVEIQQHALDPTRYRLVDPYTEGLNNEDEGFSSADKSGNQSPYVEFQILPSGSVYKGVTTTIEGLVVYGDFNTGFRHPSYGEDIFCLHPSRFTSTATEAFWTYNVVTRFSDDGKPEVVQMAPYRYMMDIGGWDYSADLNRAITIIFPGVVLADYSLEVAYAGKYTDSKDQVVGVLAQILEAGEDVESVRLAVVEGTDVDAAVEGIKSGNIDFVEVAATPATVHLPFAATEPVTGKYTIVAVAYGNGDAQTVASAEFKYTPPSSETWTARSTGDYEYSFFWEGVDPDLTLYQSNSDPNRWKIEHWGYDVDFVFSYNQTTGAIMVEDQETGYVHPSYGTVMVDDLVDYTGSTNYGQSYYEDGVFYFAVIYYVNDGYFDEFGYETFTLTDGSLAPAKAKAPSSLHRGNKKVQTASTVSRKQFIRNNKFAGSPLR
jgi:hypothetical protein